MNFKAPKYLYTDPSEHNIQERMALEEAENSCPSTWNLHRTSPPGLGRVIGRSGFRSAPPRPTAPEAAQTTRQPVHATMHLQWTLCDCLTAFHSVRWRRSRCNATINHARCSSSCRTILSPHTPKDWNKTSDRNCSYPGLCAVNCSHCGDTTTCSSSIVRNLRRYAVADVSSLICVSDILSPSRGRRGEKKSCSEKSSKSFKGCPGPGISIWIPAPRFRAIDMV